jgi:hypothetical protein
MARIDPVDDSIDYPPSHQYLLGIQIMQVDTSRIGHCTRDGVLHIIPKVRGCLHDVEAAATGVGDPARVERVDAFDES